MEDLWIENNIKILNNCQVIYVEVFFLSHSYDATLQLAKFSQQQNIPFIFNLCGEYVCRDKTFVDNVISILPYISIIFGNLSEFMVFIDTVETLEEMPPPEIRNLRTKITGEGMENLGVKIDNIDISESPVLARPKYLTAVVTEGRNPVQCYEIGDRLRTMTVEVPALEVDLIKDTIGAGDSFIAGFVHVLLMKGSLRSCIDYAVS